MRFISIFAYAVMLTLCGGTAAQADALVEAARARIGVTVIYDPSYQSLTFPGGDVADHKGVCAGVIIRAYRAAYGFDLQRWVNADMRVNFDAYPAFWGLSRPDPNIDHRRVPNLEQFLTRQNARLPTPVGAFRPGFKRQEEFKPGDLITWRLDGRLPHIGIVSDKRSAAGVPLIIHNVGAGTREEDVLFSHKIHGHFRFHPSRQRS